MNIIKLFHYEKIFALLVSGTMILAGIIIGNPAIGSDVKKPNIDSLSGITPYGMEIKEESCTVKLIKCSVKVIYSKSLSDDNMGKYMQRFYNELCKEIQRRSNSCPTENRSLKLVISNCRFCSVGYCKVKGKKEIEIIVYNNEIQTASLIFDYIDVIDKSKFQIRAIESAETLFGKNKSNNK